jgi:hypothetical protein
VLTVLEPFRKDVSGIAVESTFNWYWCVDGLMDNGYKVHLANPAAIAQYEGLKNIDDKRSALWLANTAVGDPPDRLHLSKRGATNQGSFAKEAAARAASNLPCAQYQEHSEQESRDTDEER